MDEETRIALLEIKGSLAELRLNVTERFTTVNDRFADVNTKLDTIIDVLTEFSPGVHRAHPLDDRLRDAGIGLLLDLNNSKWLPLQRSDCDGRDVGIAGLSDKIIEWGRSVEVWESGAADTGGAGELAGGGAAAGDERVAVSRAVNRPATPSGG